MIVLSNKISGYLLRMASLLILTGCAHERFVDERFYQTLLPETANAEITRLTPNKIKYNSDRNYWKVTYFCKLLENKTGYLKYSCDRSLYIHQYPEFEFRVPVKEKTPLIITFDILQYKYDEPPYENYLQVYSKHYKNNQIYTTQMLITENKEQGL